MKQVADINLGYLSLKHLVKFIGLWCALLVGLIMSAVLQGFNGNEVSSDEPITTSQALFFVTGLNAAILAVIAAQSCIKGWRLALLIFVTLFGVQSIMMQIETLYFIDNVQIPLNVLMQGVASNLFASVFAAIACALMWVEPREAQDIQRPALLPRVAVASGLYVGIYFLAGILIAWRSDALRAYYSEGTDIELLTFLAFQFFRGILWTGLAVFVALSLSGSLVTRGIIVGAAFSILAASQLLYPNTYMPWDVRAVHLIELGVSNFLFGVLAVMVLFAQRINRA